MPYLALPLPEAARLPLLSIEEVCFDLYAKTHNPYR
jgi:hypothetical protein